MFGDLDVCLEVRHYRIHDSTNCSSQDKPPACLRCKITPNWKIQPSFTLQVPPRKLTVYSFLCSVSKPNLKLGLIWFSQTNVCNSVKIHSSKESQYLKAAKLGSGKMLIHSCNSTELFKARAWAWGTRTVWGDLQQKFLGLWLYRRWISPAARPISSAAAGDICSCFLSPVEHYLKRHSSVGSSSQVVFSACKIEILKERETAEGLGILKERFGHKTLGTVRVTWHRAWEAPGAGAPATLSFAIVLLPTTIPTLETRLPRAKEQWFFSRLKLQSHRLP